MDALTIERYCFVITGNTTPDMEFPDVKPVGPCSRQTERVFLLHLAAQSASDVAGCLERLQSFSFAVEGWKHPLMQRTIMRTDVLQQMFGARVRPFKLRRQSVIWPFSSSLTRVKVGFISKRRG